jgi:hypothetical protein
MLGPAASRDSTRSMTGRALVVPLEPGECVRPGKGECVYGQVVDGVVRFIRKRRT